MDSLKLNQLLVKYSEISEQEAALKKEKDLLKSSIMEEMGDELKYSNGYYSATITPTVFFSYDDEVGAINLFKECGYNAFVIETIDTKPANTWMKKNPDTYLYKTLIEKGMMSTSITNKLSVKEVKDKDGK